MPLTSKDNGPELKPGDYVQMEFTVARTFEGVDLALVTRDGGGGQTAVSPQVTQSARLSTRASAMTVQTVGEPTQLFWQVAQVYPESGTVALMRSGLGGTLPAPVPVTFTVGAFASDLVYVAPENVPPPPATRGALPFGVGRSVAAAEPDMLPFGYEPVEEGVAAPSVGPVVTALVPNAAVLGSPSFTLHVMGTGFDLTSVIVWNGAPEPTTFVSTTELTTGVNMASATVATAVPVAVENAAGLSNELAFTFTAASRRG